MPPKLAEGQSYVGHREDVAVLNVSLPKDAELLLRKYSGGKTIGRFVARLVYEHDARQQERQRLREQMRSLMED
jgi:hypothetical protein